MDAPETAPRSGSDRLPLGLTLRYSTGQIVEGIATNAVATFLLFYVTTVSGLPGTLAGIALAAGLIVDAVLDPLIGAASDDLRSRWGRRAPFMVVGLPVIAFFLFLLFNLPTGLSTTALFVWVTALSIGFRVSMSLFIIPYQAVGAELTEDYAGRSSLMAWRWGIGMLGAFVVIFLGFGVFFKGPGGLEDRSNYLPFGAATAVLTLLVGFIGTQAVLATRNRQHNPAPSSGHFAGRVLGEIAEVWKNPSFRLLFGLALLFFSALSIHATLGLHLNTYFWKLTASQMQAPPLALAFGLFLGAPLAAPLITRVEKRTVALMGFGAVFLSFLGPASLRLLGLLPLDGNQVVIMLAVVSFLVGILMATAAIVFASMMADAIDEHEFLFGSRREGLYLAAWLFAVKASGGVGTMVAGMLIDVAGLPTGKAVEGAAPAVVSEASANLLGFWGGAAPSALILAAMGCLLMYKLDRRKHATIIEALHARRGQRIHAEMN